MEIESCSAAWREARRIENWPVCVDRRKKERGRWELARSVVSEQRGTRGSCHCHPEVHFGKTIVEVYLAVAVGPPDVTAVFVIRFGRQSLGSCVASRSIYFWLSRRCRVVLVTALCSLLGLLLVVHNKSDQ